METTWTLDTEDGHKIFGRLNSTSEASSAIIIVHGLTGHMYEYAFKRAADYFENDYDVYRFNLYDGNEQSRSLIDCTIQTHADDLNTVLKTYASRYQKVFLIGHSYGGTTVMLANPGNITAVSLWDPSFDLNQIQKDFGKNFLPSGNFYIVNWGTSYLIGKAMYEEAGRLDREACSKLAKDFDHPVQVIHAADGYYIEHDISYHSFGNDKNRRDIVKGTTHCFYEGNSCVDLLRKTSDWFRQF